MSLRKLAFTSALAATLMSSVPARRAEAGPLLDWLFHRKQPAAPAIPVGAPYAVGTAPVGPTYASGYAPLPYTAGYVPYSTGYAPYPMAGRAATPYTSGYTPYGVAYPTVPAAVLPTAPVPSVATTPTYGTYYGANNAIVGANGYGYLAQRPTAGSIVSPPAVMPSTLPSTWPSTSAPVPGAIPAAVPSSVPVTLVPDYRTTTSRTPVTYYRPVLTTDPATGAQVVTLAPCSSYEYQTQRVPTWGLTQVYNGGASLPAVGGVAPATTPTYALPRGGVPLSGPMPSTQPYTSAYGALMPSIPTTAPMSTVTPLPPTSGSVITPTAPYSSGYGGYASNYGNYSALQPPVTVPQSGTYSTAPIGGGSLGPYYNSGNTMPSAGSTGGGSTGSYTAPPYSTVPASPYATGPYSTNPYPSQSTIAPPSGATNLPPVGTAVPGVGSSPVLPPTNSTYPSTPLPTAPMPGVVYPPSSDPAAGAVPSLPPMQSGARLNSKPQNMLSPSPQLQNVVQQPIAGMRPFSASPSAPQSSSANRSSGNERPSSSEAAPGLLPIPVPDDFKHEPRWNPGLLKEQDTTAAAPARPSSSAVHVDPQIAWGSKTIHWASFTESSGALHRSQSELDQVLELSPASPPAELRDKPAHRQARPVVPSKEERSPEELGLKLVPGNQATELRMVPIPTTTPEQPATDRLELSSSATTPVTAVSPSTRSDHRYPTGGWKAR